MANWMRVQAQEEVGHAMKFFSFINERDGRVTLTEIEAPKKIAKKMIGSMSPSAIARTGFRGIMFRSTSTMLGACWARSTRLLPSAP